MFQTVERRKYMVHAGYTPDQMVKLQKYLSIRDQMKTSDGLLWGSSTMLGNAIQWFTKSDVNHFSIIFKEFKDDVTDRTFQLESLEHGPIHTILSERLLNHKGKVYWLPVKDEYDDWRVDVAKWHLEYSGKQIKYDVSALLGNALGYVSYDLKKLFCSEYGYLGWRWAYIQRVYGICDYKTALNILLSKDVEIFGFNKAPRPSDMHKMGIWKDRILIYDSDL